MGLCSDSDAAAARSQTAAALGLSAHVADGIDDRLGPDPQAEVAEDAGDVMLGRLPADEEAFGDHQAEPDRAPHPPRRWSRDKEYLQDRTTPASDAASREGSALTAVKSLSARARRRIARLPLARFSRR